MRHTCPMCAHEWDDEAILDSPQSLWQQFHDIWNAFAETLCNKGIACAKVGKKSSVLRQHLIARVKETPSFMVALEEALAYCATDPFYCGQNDRGWVADAQFILRPDKAVSLAAKHYAMQTALANKKTIQGDTDASSSSRFDARRRHDLGQDE